LYPYAVSVHMEGEEVKMIDGIDDEGNVLSNGPRANDAGIFNNTILAEYIEHPGRVFLEASADILEGQEILVRYGPEYWGIPEYPNFSSVFDYGHLPAYSNSFFKGEEYKFDSLLAKPMKKRELDFNLEKQTKNIDENKTETTQTSIQTQHSSTTISTSTSQTEKLEMYQSKF